MAIPGTTVEAVRVALFSAIQAQCAVGGQADGPLVCFDLPGMDQRADIISIGAVRLRHEPTQMVSSGGAGWLDELYTVEVIVSSYLAGDDAQGTFTQARTLVDAVYAAVRTDPTLGLGGAQPETGFVVEAHPEQTTYEASWEQDHKGRIVEALIEVFVHARC